MKTFRPLRPGDMWISAEDINALAEEVKRLGKVNVSGGATFDNGIGGLHIGVHDHPPAFWAKLTYEYGSGWYAWKEQERTNLGTFEDLLYGREDTDGMSPAYEVNGATGIAVGTYVWLELGYGLPVTGGVVQEWIFRAGGNATSIRTARLQMGISGEVPIFLGGPLTGSYTRVQWESLYYDTGGFFDSERPYSFTAPAYSLVGTTVYLKTGSTGITAGRNIAVRIRNLSIPPSDTAEQIAEQSFVTRAEPTTFSPFAAITVSGQVHYGGEVVVEVAQDAAAHILLTAPSSFWIRG